MRKAYLILAILIIAATAPAQLVMRHDGKTDNTLTQVPKYAVRFLDGGGWISRLDSADWHTRNRCGYYEAVRAVADPGMVITGRAWPDEPTDGVFREQITAQITQAEHDAAQAAAEAAVHNSEAPGGDLATWSKREKCLLLITFKLAKEHWPSMTKEQFLNNVQAEWDQVQ